MGPDLLARRSMDSQSRDRAIPPAQELVLLVDAVRAREHRGRFWTPQMVVPGYRLSVNAGLGLDPTVGPAQLQ